MHRATEKDRMIACENMLRVRPWKWSDSNYYTYCV